MILDKSGVSDLIRNKNKQYGLGGRPSYRECDMFATILYGFAFKNRTLRDLESACQFDLRYIYLMQQIQPTYVSFGNFINEVILPNTDEIFYRITKTIIDEFDIDTSEVFIDGTKFEADANKYKFVWKPTKYHERLSDKIRQLLKQNGISRNVPENGIIESKTIALKLTELSKKIDDSIDEKERSRKKKDLDKLYEYLNKALDYEEKERICGPNRNSYYKTDHGATAMCLKSDYYSGLGSSMHAAYSTQLVVSKGIIKAYYVSQSRNDYNDFVPTLKLIKNNYGQFPRAVCADSGYGSSKNYEFLVSNNIENYVKYRSWEGNVSGKNPDRYFLNDDETITCLNGNNGKRIDILHRHPTRSGAVFYKVQGCNECEFMPYCKKYLKTKDENERIFEVNESFIKSKQTAERNLLTPKGIEMRVNRSSQIEGAYGVIKQDMEYTRLKRTTLEKAKLEIMLICIGYNIRKLFRYFEGKAKFDYWVAPSNLKEEKFKRPSAKRLSKKAQKASKKSVNEEAKSNYKYKG